jgi:hypothetical protein
MLLKMEAWRCGISPHSMQASSPATQKIYEICREKKGSQWHIEHNHFGVGSKTKTQPEQVLAAIPFAGVTHYIPDCWHFHHEWQWPVAIISCWLHQLPSKGVNKYTTICSKFQANNYTKICLVFLFHLCNNNKTLIMLATNQHKNDQPIYVGVNCW